jgi:hypothetical protein
MEAPQYPAGQLERKETLTAAERAALIAEIEGAPRVLREAVAGLQEAQLDTKYRNWTIRQIVHHLADSHLNSYFRFRLALTEDNPTVKSVNIDRWAALPDAVGGSVAASLSLFEGLHQRWAHLMKSMTEADFRRTFHNAERQQTPTLELQLQIYAFHVKHHVGAIQWLRKQRGW